MEFGSAMNRYMSVLILLILLSACAGTDSYSLGDDDLTATPILLFAPINASIPTATLTPVKTSTPAATRTITPTAVSPLSFIETSTGTYQNWPQYIHTVYGFSFAAPPDWKVSELGNNFIQVSSPTDPGIKLTIGVRWADEDVMMQRTGVPEGDIVLVGEVNFLGQKISKGILQYHNKDKEVLYNNCVQISSDNLVFTLGFSDFNGDYDAINLPVNLVETADAIVESFALIK
jgi:hypothetical protein